MLVDRISREDQVVGDRLKKIDVPGPMLAAAQKAAATKAVVGNRESYVAEALEAALLWITENPLVVRDTDLSEMRRKWDSRPLQSGLHSVYEQFVADEIQRRVFLAPEPEPAPDLIAIANKLTANPNWRSADLYHALLEAFRLGESRKKESVL
jgi:hypothetical protein